MCFKCVINSTLHPILIETPNNRTEVFAIKNLYGKHIGIITKITKRLPNGKRFLHLKVMRSPIIKSTPMGLQFNIIPPMEFCCDLTDNWFEMSIKKIDHKLEEINFN